MESNCSSKEMKINFLIRIFGLYPIHYLCLIIQEFCHFFSLLSEGELEKMYSKDFMCFANKCSNTPFKRLKVLLTERNFSTSLSSNLNKDQYSKMLSEQCIRVNTNDEIIGNASKKECHETSNSYLHRAFSVLLFDECNRLLMQQRSAEKITFPNYWTNSCCSHPLFIDDHCEYNFENHNSNENGNKITKMDERIEDKQQKRMNGVKRAAMNRLNFELGIETTSINLNELHFQTRIIYKAICDDQQWIEHEMDYVLIIQQNVNDCKSFLNLNIHEVSDAKFCNQTELESMMNDPKIMITPWFKILYNSFLIQWWNDLEDIVSKERVFSSSDELIHDFTAKQGE